MSLHRCQVTAREKDLRHIQFIQFLPVIMFLICVAPFVLLLFSRTSFQQLRSLFVVPIILQNWQVENFIELIACDKLFLSQEEQATILACSSFNFFIWSPDTLVVPQYRPLHIWTGCFPSG